MGSSSWSSDAFQNFSRSASTKTTNQIFTQNVKKTISPDMSPKGIVFRECRDSDAHSESLAIFMGLDVTGSMGMIPEVLVRDKLGTLMDTLLKHKVVDPAVLFAAIGDATSDHYPLQVGQFESGTDELVKWLSSAYLEGGGGGQMMESYLLAWLFAARHTSIDCFEKRKQKGVLFTMGDEKSWDKIDPYHLTDLMGYTEATELTASELLAEAQRMYHVFHIHINEGSYRDSKEVLDYWKGMIGERLIVCNDYTQVAELIATTVAIIHGIDIDAATSTFDSKTATDVKNALVHVNTSITKPQDNVIQL